MVEVNCETDFVARNSTFTEFVSSVTQACCAHAAQMPTNNGSLSKVNKPQRIKLHIKLIQFHHSCQVDFDVDALKNMSLNDGKSLSDHLALIIGKVGENASLRRATCFRSTTDTLTLAAFTHPPVAGKNKDAVQMGKFGAIVALQQQQQQIDSDATAVAEIQRNICQHIVGMNPQRIGNAEVDKPAESKDDEVCLIWQEYLLEPSMTVGELLAENNMNIVDFHRYECGEVVAVADGNKVEMDDIKKEAAAN